MRKNPPFPDPKIFKVKKTILLIIKDGAK